MSATVPGCSGWSCRTVTLSSSTRWAWPSWIHARPMTGDDQVRIGSLTKTYVAALVLLLESEGLLATADPLQRWLPGLIPGGEEITLETLLRLRSGLPDYLEPLMGSPPDLGALERYWAPEQLVELALAAPGRIAPNIEYRYCNLDFVLLGLVVERATRQRVEAQLWQRFFEPLGLTDTTFPTVDPRLRGRHADGHLRLGPSAPFIGAPPCRHRRPSLLGRSCRPRVRWPCSSMRCWKVGCFPRRL